jgi:hypothetical protein
MGSNAHVVDETGQNRESKEPAETKARVVTDESGRAKGNSTGQYRAWLGPTGGTFGKLATFLIEGSVNLISALASGAMAIVAPLKSNPDPLVSKANSYRRSLNATRDGATSETMAINDGPSGGRLAAEPGNAGAIEAPVLPAPLAAGPAGVRSPNLKRGRG